MSTSGNTAWYFLKHYKKSSKFLQTSNKPSNLPPWNSFSKRTYAYSKRQIYIKTTKIDPELRQIVLSSNNSLSNSSNCLGCLPKYCNILVAELVEKRHYYPCPLKYKLNCVWSTRDLERAVPVARPELLVPMKLRSGPEKELKREQPLQSTRLLPNFWNVLKKKWNIVWPSPVVNCLCRYLLPYLHSDLKSQLEKHVRMPYIRLLTKVHRFVT